MESCLIVSSAAAVRALSLAAWGDASMQDLATTRPLPSAALRAVESGAEPV